MKKFLILLFFYLLALKLIQCANDCATLTKDNCNSGHCRWMKINSNNASCMECSGIDDGESKYYSRKYSIDNRPFCHKVGKSGYSGAKMIYGTMQIVKNCKEFGLYSLGDFCYDSSCPENSIESSDKICKCEYLFYKEIKEGLIYYNCLGEEEYCPENYFYRNDKECVKACPSAKPYLEEIVSSNDKDYSCKAQCPYNLKIYTEKSPSGNKNITYCLQNCPDNAKYYYDDNNICIEKCSNKDFYNQNNKCIHSNNIKTDCGSNYYIKVSKDENIFQCIQDNQNPSCPGEFPYKYSSNQKTYCLKTCSDTNITFFDNVVSYLYTKNNECKDISKLNGLFLIEKEKKIVDDCSEDKYYPYYDGNKCVSNCGDKYIDNDSNECLEDCKDSKNNNYFRDEKTKICFKKCPDYLGRGFYYENKTCVSCGKEGDGKGFHKITDDDTKCYTQCPTGFKHNYLNNICFEGECLDHDYKYSYDGHPGICYYTCKDIGEDFIIEKDYKCYNKTDNTFKDYYFYETDYGIKKYLKKTFASTIKECVTNGKKYIRNNQCVDKCDIENEYKVYPTNDKFGFCFKNTTECKNNNYKFYNNSKICSNKCDYYTIRETTVDLEINGENCVTKCPDSFPYLDNKICIKKCSKYFSDESGVNKCQNSCYDYILKKIVNGEEHKKCVKYCGKEGEVNEFGFLNFTFFYTDNNNKICVESCNIGDLDKKFALSPINGPKECLFKCPNDYPYYYENNKICLKKCNNGDYYDDNNMCVNQCSNNQYIHPVKKCRNSRCPADFPFYIQNDANSPKECLFSCPTDYYFIKEEDGYKCVEDNINNQKILYSELIPNCPSAYEYNECKKPSDFESDLYKYDINGLPEKVNEDECTYKTSLNECVEKCPIGERFINSKECQKICNSYYKISDDNGDYKTYDCLENDDVYSQNPCLLSKNYHKYNEKECLQNCGNLYLNTEDNICYSNCSQISGKNFLVIDDNNKIQCKSECEQNLFYGQEKICERECLFQSLSIYKNGQKECISQCNSTNNYLQIKNNQLYCSNACEDINSKKHNIDEFLCISKCESPYNYIDTENNTCYKEKCPDDRPYIKSGDFYLCSKVDNCPQDYPYSYNGSKLCLSSCYPGDYVKEGTNICVESCSSLGENYYFFEYDKDLDEKPGSPKYDSCVASCETTNKPKTRKNRHCDVECDINPLGDHFYNYSDVNQCLEKRQIDVNYKIDGRIIVSSCEEKYEIENGYCTSNCYYSSGTSIYSDSNKICKDNPNDFIIEKNFLRNTCSNNNNLYYEGQCVNECPKGKNIILDENNKICLNDCSEELQCLTQSSSELFKCENNLSSQKTYIRLIEKQNATICFSEEICISTYPYFIETTNRKECFEKCPEEYIYYSDEENGEKKCMKNIPENYYSFEDTNRLILDTKCFPNYINIDINKCVTKCNGNNQVYFEFEHETNKIIYCSENCNNIKNKIQIELYLKINSNECVKAENCSGENEEPKIGTNICDCKNLFYNDTTTGKIVCIDKNENNCMKQLEYPYLIDQTFQCNNTCEGILSLDGSICYQQEYLCPDYSHSVTLINGLQQCVCDYKYYYNYYTDNEKEIVCLQEESECPHGKELYISETKECVEYCPFDKYSKKFGKTCVDSCPEDSKIVNDECFCEDKWYTDENGAMICTNECPGSKPIQIEETKECVKTCINTDYPVLYRNRCYSNCEKFPETDLIENIQEIEQITDETNIYFKYKGYNLNRTYGHYATNICYCKYAWYEDGTNFGCSINSIDINNNPCKEFDNINSYKYIILPTKQCVKECPNNYKFSFNGFCFESCERGNTLLEYNNDNKILQDGDSNKCKCQNLWKYNNNDLSKIECLEEEKCGNDELLIVATRECYYGNQCKEEYPLIFNKECYNIENCNNNIKNTIYKEDSPRACSCIKYYYIDSNNEKICLPENIDCPTDPDYPYLIYTSNKCVKNNDEELIGLVNFNGIYYNNCPLYTKYDDTIDSCICDFIYGFWYYDDNNNLECAKVECPDDLPQFIANTRQCIKKCVSEDNTYVEYNGICYEVCPELTKANENRICQLETTYDSNNVTEITKIIEDNIVLLYDTSAKKEKENEDSDDIDSNIIELPNSNLTVEFYGVNKNKNKKDKKEKHNNKDKISSSLSFIDLSECIEKIYETNNMAPDEDIIILKYDLKDTPKEYLINPVEYKFISSFSGKELDASACGHGAIKISYPFFNIISNYDNLTKKKRSLKSVTIDLKNENDLTTLSEKYNLGKEINDEYSEIDTFNSKNNIYTDFCTAVEINGKDLILEDRMNYLLPHYSLCEKNCSYNHTDFEEERIYCDCSFKNEFDLNREHEPEINLNENVVVLSQNGKTNFPALKCISVLGDSNRIKKNISFYYMLIIIIIEICLLVMTLLLGINSFTQFLRNKIYDCDVTENDKIEIIEKDKDNKKYEDEIIKTTQRALNAPPLKKNNNDNNNEENNNEKNDIEFIPEEFLFLYFNDNDKGVRKQIEKNELPFNINPNTKVLLQKMENIDYSIVKASGPFHEDQNLIEVIDNTEEPVNINIESINETINDNNINEKNKNQNNELITISEEKIYKKEDNSKDYIINELDEIVENNKKEIKTNKTFLSEIKLEQRLLTKDYNFTANTSGNVLLNLIITEIFDKIYIIKNILFIRKFEIMYLYLSVYVLYHVFLVTILGMLYDINTIKKIWNKENYPGFGLHLGYGLLSLLISWIIYIIIMCLLTNRGKYNEIMNIKNAKKIKKGKGNKIQLINKKSNSLITKMKTKMIVYYIVQFLLIIAFFIYLVTLGAVYSGTMKKIFSSYGVAILEVIIIKILYGLVLAILRHSSLSNKKESLYNIVLFFDKYIV